MVYSINDEKSFKGLKYWHDLYKEQIGDEILFGVVGNKSDLYLNQKISEQEGQEYAKEHGGIFVLLSAKEWKILIDEYILKLAKEFLDKKYNKIHIKDFKIIEDREKGIILTNKQIKDLGWNDDGCCGGKTKERRKKYEEILKKIKDVIESIFLELME